MNFNVTNLPGNAGVLNEAANVNYYLGNYKISDTLYKRVIKNNENR